ncbi:ribokinase [Corynebacterium aquilae]|uniref:ribokinase n=1 Tax=Corynebacterium aquilae TaxID=203263 RepID=UPI000950FD69|nr:ribokinase [Corynebacterium aquilae]
MGAESYATASFDVAVVGSINVDQVLRVDRHPTPGETVMGKSLNLTAGGKGANQAVAAALQGAAVVFVGAYGNDSYQDIALEHLRHSGVDLGGTKQVDSATGFAAIQVSDDGENSIVVFAGANAHVDGLFVQDQADVIRRSSILLMQGEIPADGFKEAVEIASTSRRRIVVNLAPVIPVDHAALLKADPLIANQHEARLILSEYGVRGSEDSDFDTIIQQLCNVGFASVVLTLGADGALVAEKDERGNVKTEAVASPRVHAVDTTGAGDAFAGALVSRLAKGDSLQDAAKHAVRVGAYAVQKAGAQTSYPDLSSQLPSF